MPKSAVTKARLQPDRGPGQEGRVSIAPDRPPLRLARRHRLSRARGVLLGVVIGLLVWSLVALVLFHELS